MQSQRQKRNLPITSRVPFSDDGSAFYADVGFGPLPKRVHACSGAITVSSTDPHAPVPAVVTKHIGASPINQTSTAVPQQLLWQRMGYPSSEAWRYLTSVTTNHGQPPNLPLSSTLLANDSVMRGRARARPYLHTPDTATSLPPPGAVWYMDHTGKMIPSHPHRFTGYFGIIDRGSGYSRLFPVHQFTAENARRCYDAFAADLRSKMGLTHAVKPSLVVSDQGSAYMARHFREMLDDEHVLFRPSSTYSPEQNQYI
jgi:transposase InsO family protein